MTEVPITAVTTSPLCWNCGGNARRAPFCPACGAIQTLPPDVDFFELLGVIGRLNFPEAEIEKTYHEFSRRFHPDFYRQKTEREREASLQNSALLNEAYRTLKDPFQRAEYVLKGNKKGIEETKQVPKGLLEEVLEFQEALADLRSSGPPAAGQTSPEAKVLHERVQEWSAKLSRELMVTFQDWDAGSGNREALLERMEEIVLQRRYVKNLLRDVAGLTQESLF